MGTHTQRFYDLPSEILLNPETIPETPFETQLNTNYVPTGQDLSLIKDITSGLQRQMAAVDAIIRECEKKKKFLQERIDAHNALLSPIRRVPDDVLLEIFLHCCLLVGEYYPRLAFETEGPLLFGRVCRQWKTISQHPRLWCQVHVPSIAYHSMQRTIGFVIERLNQWIEKSKDSPLSLSFNDHPMVLENLLTKSEVPSKSHRVENLAIGYDCLSGVKLPQNIVNPVFFENGFLNVKNLKIFDGSTWSDTQLQSNFFEQCAMVRQARIRSLTLALPIGPMNTLLPFIPLKQLTSISFLRGEVTDMHCPRRYFSLCEALQIIHEGSRLIELRLAIKDTLDENHIIRRQVHNTSLRVLLMVLHPNFEVDHACEFSSRLSLPALSFVHTKTERCLPSLDSPHAYPFLFGNIGQTLTSLTTTWSKIWKHADTDIKQLSIYTPNLVQFRSNQVSDRDFSPADWSVEDIDTEEGDRLLHFLTPVSESPTRWPKLQYLELDLGSGVTFSDLAIYNFVCNRALSTTPLRQVFFKLPRDMGRNLCEELRDLTENGLSIRIEYQERDGYDTVDVDDVWNRFFPFECFGTSAYVPEHKEVTTLGW